MSLGFGGGPWGETPWGGGWVLPIPPTASFLSAIAIRENMFRLEFAAPIEFTYLGGARDGSAISHYSVSPVAGTIGLDALPARAITAATIEQTDIAETGDADFGRFLDFTVDRPMSPYPCLYSISVVGLFAVGSLAPINESVVAYAAYRQLAVPLSEFSVPSRDIASPQTLSSFYDPLPEPDRVLLGSFAVDDNGDYAFDEGLVNFKKRVLRRLIFRKGKFPHMPGYGVGVPASSKQLDTAATRGRLAAEAERQILLEPDCKSCTVSVVSDPNKPGLVRFQIVATTHKGQTTRFDVPFAAV
jgi:hypothetical protein